MLSLLYIHKIIALNYVHYLKTVGAEAVLEV